ncbi:hypothetical protein [Paractinoplanes atraurantiacus]|uniref:Uncharacterized protein n=1 Tax=Paractinoplanes atraurantiacus TaxID=1036182 RepID=A0A285H014_9ACTN|nr:hypothetical protein [Actinoplanes atraurantiacus]SNY29112.1 hypothetical protein SAMN05421748_103193 [Actinoplanes atraurantiacus]
MTKNETTLAELGARRAALRAELKDLMERIEVKIREDMAAGKSERQAATEAQVDRMYVRKLLGK